MWELMTNKLLHKTNQVPLLEQVPMGGQVPVVTPPMTDVEIRLAVLNSAQCMTSQDNVVTSQD